MGLPSHKVIAGKGEEDVLPVLVVLYAGFFAELVVNPKAILEEGFDQSDGDRALEYAKYSLLAPPKMRDGKLVSSIDIDRLKSLINAAKERAEMLVKKHSDAIDELASLLDAHGSLRAAEIHACVGSFFAS